VARGVTQVGVGLDTAEAVDHGDVLVRLRALAARVDALESRQR
jgi:hypothetical protein